MAKVDPKVEREYHDLLYQLGETACAILAGDSAWRSRFRSYARVEKARDALHDRRLELATIEQQMDDEERGLADAKSAGEEEMERCQALATKFRKAINAVDEELKGLERQRVNREGALKYVYKAEKDEQRRIADLEEAGKLDRGSWPGARSTRSSWIS